MTTTLVRPPSAVGARRSGLVAPYVLVLPALLFLVGFVLVPCVLVIVLSVTDYNPLTAQASFVGLDNYRAEIESGELQRGVANTVRYALLAVPVTVAGGLTAALAMHELTHLRALWRSIYFVPTATTLISMAIVWRWIFADHDVLNDPATALPALAVVGIWQQTGFATIVFLAALESVPVARLDAARMDGAPWSSRLRHVVLPALGPATVFCVVVSALEALRVFDTVAMITAGGPEGSTETLTYQMWQRSLRYFDVGGGAVLTVALLLLTAGFTVVYLLAGGRRAEKAGTR